MIIDIDSYNEHNNHYAMASLEKIKAAHEKLTQDKVQYNSDNPLGKTIDACAAEIKIGVDIGTGHGWGANFLAQHFDRVYGIEPSKSALKFGKEIYKDVDNITWVHGFAEEQLPKLKLNTPTFFYCACVLSHLQHETVSVICEAIDKIAKPGSTFSFSENWGQMHATHCWYSRTKEWWTELFPGWELSFFKGNNSQQGMNKGIVGIKK